MMLTVMSLAGTSVLSTGLVLNRRSVSAEKYWTGPIYFLLDRAFSNQNCCWSTLWCWVNAV